MFEVGRTCRCRPEGGGVKRAASGRDQHDDDQPACDFEAPVGDILVRDAVTREMERWPKQSSRHRRATRSAHGRTGRGVQRDDHFDSLADGGIKPRPV